MDYTRIYRAIYRAICRAWDGFVLRTDIILLWLAHALELWVKAWGKNIVANPHGPVKWYVRMVKAPTYACAARGRVCIKNWCHTVEVLVRDIDASLL